MPNLQFSAGGKTADIGSDKLGEMVGHTFFFSEHDLARLGIHQRCEGPVCGNTDKGINVFRNHIPGVLPFTRTFLFSTV